MIELLIKGIIVGLGASIPLGPLGVLCIQKTLSKGKWSGVATGMGGAVSDLFFSALALFGLAMIQEWLQRNDLIISLVGGVIIMGIGVSVFVTNPIKQLRRPKETNQRYWGDFLTSFAMTITNPGALLLLLGLFTFVGLDLSVKSLPRITIVLAGVMGGAMIWWMALAGLINKFRNRFRLRQLLSINRIAGIAIFILGLIYGFKGLIQPVFDKIQ
ncbi:MAG: LysE family transporter [Bacteroidales bacterium]|nr:LysE family transporter [Bacteroidales bacterium]